MPPVSTPEPQHAPAIAVAEPARRIGVWARFATALRVDRRRTTDKSHYPPRRPAFIADAAMEREMHRL